MVLCANAPVGVYTKQLRASHDVRYYPCIPHRRAAGIARLQIAAPKQIPICPRLWKGQELCRGGHTPVKAQPYTHRQHQGHLHAAPSIPKPSRQSSR